MINANEVYKGLLAKMPSAQTSEAKLALVKQLDALIQNPESDAETKIQASVLVNKLFPPAIHPSLPIKNQINLAIAKGDFVVSNAALYASEFTQDEIRQLLPAVKKLNDDRMGVTAEFLGACLAQLPAEEAQPHLDDVIKNLHSGNDDYQVGNAGEILKAFSASGGKLTKLDLESRPHSLFAAYYFHSVRLSLSNNMHEQMAATVLTKLSLLPKSHDVKILRSWYLSVLNALFHDVTQDFQKKLAPVVLTHIESLLTSGVDLESEPVASLLSAIAPHVSAETFNMRMKAVCAISNSEISPDDFGRFAAMAGFLKASKRELNDEHVDALIRQAKQLHESFKFFPFTILSICFSSVKEEKRAAIFEEIKSYDNKNNRFSGKNCLFLSTVQLFSEYLPKEMREDIAQSFMNAFKSNVNNAKPLAIDTIASLTPHVSEEIRNEILTFTLERLKYKYSLVRDDDMPDENYPQDPRFFYYKVTNAFLINASDETLRKIFDNIKDWCPIHQHLNRHIVTLAKIILLRKTPKVSFGIDKFTKNFDGDNIRCLYTLLPFLTPKQLEELSQLNQPTYGVANLVYVAHTVLHLRTTISPAATGSLVRMTQPPAAEAKNAPSLVNRSVV